MFTIGMKYRIPINKDMKDYILKSTYESVNRIIEKNKNKQNVNYNIDLNNLNNLNNSNEVITYSYEKNLKTLIFFLSISSFWFLYSNRK